MNKAQEQKKRKVINMITEEFLRKEYVVKIKSSYKIAKEIGVSKSLIYKRLKKFKLNRTKSDAQKGRKQSEETKRKISKSKKGTIFSKEHKKKISDSLKERIPWNKGKKIPKRTKEEYSRWKGGRYKNRQGYFCIHDENHPYKNSKNYVLEHRIAVEKKIGRYLKTEEVVHHIDEDKGNNDINNLMPFKTQKLHAKFHTKIRQFGITQPIKTQIKNRWNEYE